MGTKGLTAIIVVKAQLLGPSKFVIFVFYTGIDGAGVRTNCHNKYSCERHNRTFAINYAI